MNIVDLDTYRRRKEIARVPHVLPTLVVEPDEEEVDPCDIIHMSLPTDTLLALYRQGLTMQDVLDGRVPGIDPEAILEAAAREMDEER